MVQVSITKFKTVNGDVLLLHIGIVGRFKSFCKRQLRQLGDNFLIFYSDLVRTWYFHNIPKCRGLYGVIHQWCHQNFRILEPSFKQWSIQTTICSPQCKTSPIFNFKYHSSKKQLKCSLVNSRNCIKFSSLIFSTVFC